MLRALGERESNLVEEISSPAGARLFGINFRKRPDSKATAVRDDRNASFHHHSRTQDLQAQCLQRQG